MYILQIVLVPNYTSTVGSLEEDGFTYSSEATIGPVIGTCSYYESTRMIRDYSCTIADDREFTGKLGNFTGAIHVVKSGHGFGPRMQANVELFSNASSVRTNYIPVFAHTDHYGSPFRS